MTIDTCAAGAFQKVMLTDTCVRHDDPPQIEEMDGKRILRAYHGTSPDNARYLKRYGVCVSVPWKRDAGDFGHGFYVSTLRGRARTYGAVLFAVDLDVSRFAFIPRPYHVIERAETEEERLFLDVAFDTRRRALRTVCQDYDNEKAAQEVRNAFLRHGYSGIVSNYAGNETVVFDPSAVLSLSVVE